MLPEKEIVVVCSDDWRMVYLDGKLIYAGHHFDIDNLVRLSRRHGALLIPWREWLNSKSQDWLIYGGGAHTNDLSDIPREYLE